MDRPNILLITTDQQRFDTIAALGHRHVLTPHLDWLCDEGIAFTRAYSDAPVCVPARVTLMTGKHGYRAGCVGNAPLDPPPLSRHPTLPGLLTAHGYQTRAQGKMHFQPKRACYGFEQMELEEDYARFHPHHRRGCGLGGNEVVPGFATMPATESPTAWVVDRSLAFLETRDPARPFFLWTSFVEPHPPFNPCAEFAGLYRDLAMPEPVVGNWSRAGAPAGLMAPTWSLSPFDRLTPEGIRASRRAYHALISQVDYALGRLFGRLRSLGLLQHTWIIFTSDHGEMLGDHGMGSKLTHLEGSAHVPLIIRPPAAGWPVPEEWGTRCDALVSLADIMPTCLTLAGAAVPADVDGRDLVAIARGRAPAERVHLGDCGHRQFCVIRDHLKYHWSAEGGTELLFDLATDPYEGHDLGDGPAMAELRALLVAHLQAQGSPLAAAGTLRPQPATTTRRGAMRYPCLSD